MHHRQADIDAVMYQFRSQRISETHNGVLGPTICGLQRNRPKSQRRTDLHNSSAVPWFHSVESRHRAVDISEVTYLGGSPVLFGSDLVKRREDRSHRIVDPNINWAELTLDSFRRRFDLFSHG